MTQFRRFVGVAIREVLRGSRGVDDKPQEDRMNAAEVLDRAAELIVERGWAQGDDVGGGRVCAVIAVSDASHEGAALGVWGEAHDALREVVGAHVPDWNDAPERTVEDVLLAMKQAAHDLREESKRPDRAS